MRVEQSEFRYDVALYRGDGRGAALIRRAEAVDAGPSWARVVTPGAGITAEYVFIEYHSGDAVVYAVDGAADAQFPREAYLDARLRAIGQFNEADDLLTALREDRRWQLQLQAVRERSESSVSVRAERAAADLINPTTASRHLIEYAVLRTAGLGDLAAELVALSNEVADQARKAVTALLRELFGGRRPQLSGWHSLSVFLLTFAGVVPVAFLAMMRFGAADTAVAAAVSAGIVGVLQWGAAASVFGKPVPRSTLMQAQVSAALLVGVCVVGLVGPASSASWLFVIGAGGSALALGMYLFGRRDPHQRQSIDDALETAYLDVGAEVAVKRERILRPIPVQLEERGIEEADLRAVRSATIALLRERGNPAVDDAPESVPGYYLVSGHTGAWLPPTHSGHSLRS